MRINLALSEVQCTTVTASPLSRLGKLCGVGRAAVLCNISTPSACSLFQPAGMISGIFIRLVTLAMTHAITLSLIFIQMVLAASFSTMLELVARSLIIRLICCFQWHVVSFPELRFPSNIRVCHNHSSWRNSEPVRGKSRFLRAAVGAARTPP